MTVGGKSPQGTKQDKNEDFAWSQFDSEAYFQHYYGEPHPDDDSVIRRACAALIDAEPKGGRLSVVDVGTGPNLFPMLLALPRASQLTAWEFSDSNVTWLKKEISHDTMRPQWEHFWKVVVDLYGPERGLPDNPKQALRNITEVEQGSVYDLPERRWDAATMFFCAEFDNLRPRPVREGMQALRALRPTGWHPGRGVSGRFLTICRG